MSSIRLKKDYDGKKSGAIISVPFAVGKNLIAQGIGEYPEDIPPGGLPAVEAPVLQARGPVAKGGEVKAPAGTATTHTTDGEEQHVKPEFPPQPQPGDKGAHKQK